MGVTQFIGQLCEVLAVEVLISTRKLHKTTRKFVITNSLMCHILCEQSHFVRCLLVHSITFDTLMSITKIYVLEQIKYRSLIIVIHRESAEMQ